MVAEPHTLSSPRYTASRIAMLRRLCFSGIWIAALLLVIGAGFVLSCSPLPGPDAVWVAFTLADMALLVGSCAKAMDFLWLTDVDGDTLCPRGEREPQLSASGTEHA